MSHLPAAAAVTVTTVTREDDFLPGHPNTPMWVRIMQATAPSPEPQPFHFQPPSPRPLAQRAAKTIQLCLRGHLARRTVRQMAAALKAKGSARNKLGRRMNALRPTSDGDLKEATISAPKMTLRDAALNVMFVNMLLNRTFLRSQQEQKEMETAVRTSFPCFEGMSSAFLTELMAIAKVMSIVLVIAPTSAATLEILDIVLPPMTRDTLADTQCAPRRRGHGAG